MRTNVGRTWEDAQIAFPLKYLIFPNGQEHARAGLWRWRQSRETCLCRSEFPASRERTGNFSRFGLFARFRPLVSDGSCLCIGQNSLLAVAGNFLDLFFHRGGVTKGVKPVRLVACRIGCRGQRCLIRSRMKEADEGSLSRLRARPQWGWSGVQVVRGGRMPRAKLWQIVQQLPRRESSIARLVAELREYGVRFRSDLAQDEYGPTRAERTAALRETLEALEQTRSATQDLSKTARQVLAEALTATRATDDCAPEDPFARFEADKSALEELWLAAMDASQHVQSCASSTDLETVARLGLLAEQAYWRLQSLDTTTDGELFFQWTTRDALQEDGRGDGAAAIDSPIHRLEGRLRRELNRLSRLKGPDRRTSLPLLVARLCDLWARETGHRVSFNPFEKNHYTGVPQSETGAFVCEVVELLKPETSELRARMRFSGRASAPRLKSQLDCNPTALHSAMRRYIQARDSNPAPQRQPP